MSASITATHVYRPSTARLIVLDGFTPVPRGAVPSTPVTPTWPVKDPADVLDYAIDLSGAVTGDDGDSIANVTVGVMPNATGDLSLNSAAMDGTLVVLWLANGNSGTTYTVTLTIALASGRVLSRSIALPVYSLSVLSGGATFLLTESGQELTDQSGSPIVVVGS